MRMYDIIHKKREGGELDVYKRQAPAGGDGKRFGDHTGILAVWAFACGTAHHQDYRAGAGALCGLSLIHI